MSSLPHLMVSPYAPYRDGISTYVVQEVRSRVRAGENIEVMSPLPTAAHHHLALGNLRGVAALIKRAKNFSKITIQVYPEILFGTSRNRIERILIWRALVRLAKLVPVELRVHELTYSSFARSRSERKAAKACFEAADSITLHTAPEAQQLSDALDIDPASIEIIDHGQHFEPACQMNKSEARKYLEVDESKHIFLCIGFIQVHKGFDRAVAAAEALEGEGAEVIVVGSTRVSVPELLEYTASLSAIAGTTANSSVREQFVSDHDFDAWIIAADTVILPYREIWSSGVLERAKLLDRPVICSDVGGLREQGDETTKLFDTNLELAKLMAQAAGTKVKDNGEQIMAEHEIAAGELASEIRARAGVGKSGSVKPRTGSKKLNQLGSLSRPSADSPSKAKSKLKQTILRLINWQVDPVATHVTNLQNATSEAIGALEARVDALEESQ